MSAVLSEPSLDPGDAHAADAKRPAMWDIERANPGRMAALYALSITLALLLSHASAQGWLPW